MSINVHNFLDNKKILHNDSTSLTYNEGLRFFISNSNDVDIITFNNIKQFALYNIDVLKKDNDDNYYYEYSIDRIGDIVDNIKLESDTKAVLSYNIGGYNYTYNEVDKFVIIGSQYHECKIRITFLEKPNINEEFKLHFRYYIINTNDRRLIMNNKMETDKLIYECGMVQKKEIQVFI